MKKILIDAANINQGGAVQVTLSVIQNASKTKCYQWFLAVSSEIDAQIDVKIRQSFSEIKVLDAGNLKAKWNNAPLLKAYEKQLAPDLVFSVFGPVYWRPETFHVQGFAYSLSLYPFKQWFNTLNPVHSLCDGLRSKFKKILIAKEGHYIVETETLKNRMVSELKMKAEKIFVVQNSVSPVFESLAKKSIVRKKPGIRFFVPSAYYCHKNLEIVPLVANELVKKNMKDFKFIFILPPLSQGWANIRRIAQKLKVWDKMTNLGPLAHKEMACQYKESDLVFLPTLVETSTAVYPEAFLSRKPLVTSDRPFARELCGNGAAYVNPKDSKQIAEKLLEIMKNKKLQKKMVKNGLSALKSVYPNPNEKWQSQLKVFANVLREADNGKERNR